MPKQTTSPTQLQRRWRTGAPGALAGTGIGRKKPKPTPVVLPAPIRRPKRSLSRTSDAAYSDACSDASNGITPHPVINRPVTQYLTRACQPCSTFFRTATYLEETMAAKKFNAVFSSGFRFVDKSGASIAVLDADGKFTLKEGNSNIEMFQSWVDFVKQFNGTPTLGTEEEILAQLESLVMATRQVIDVPGTGPSGHVPKAAPKPKPTVEAASQEETTDMATKTKKAAPKKAAAKKEPKEQQPCVCGCGTPVNKNFAQGHDARVHGWAKKVARGDMKFSDIGTKDYPSRDPQRAVNFLKKEMGVTQGTAAKK